MLAAEVDADVNAILNSPRVPHQERRKVPWEIAQEFFMKGRDDA